jgi:hypothetical protein
MLEACPLALVAALSTMMPLVPPVSLEVFVAESVWVLLVSGTVKVHVDGWAVPKNTLSCVGPVADEPVRVQEPLVIVVDTALV